MLSHQWQNIMHRVLSSQCGLCRLPIKHSAQTNALRWCEHCFQYLTPVKRCQRCGLHVEDADWGLICGQCLSDPPPWQRLFTLGDYDYPLSREVQRFKDYGESWHIKALTALLAQQISTPAPLITSVPLHWQRYLQRGFNQSDVLARYLAQHLYTNYHAKLFRRIKHGQSQRGNSKTGREQNLKGAFILDNMVPCSHVAIVDDVVTTGSTVRQLCHLLLEVGVESVDIYCICRTPAPISL